jgi:hypothetical protein
MKKIEKLPLKNEPIFMALDTTGRNICHPSGVFGHVPQSRDGTICVHSRKTVPRLPKPIEAFPRLLKGKIKNHFFIWQPLLGGKPFPGYPNLSKARHVLRGYPGSFWKKKIV